MAAAQAKPGSKFKGLVSPRRACDIRDVYAGIGKEKGHRCVSAMLNATQLIVIAELKEFFLLT